MKLFDLHCDTLYRAVDENGSIIDNNYHLSVLKGNKYDNWAQCFAVWIPDEYRNESALAFFRKAKEKFENEINKYSNIIEQCRNANDIKSAIEQKKCAAILTVEGGAVLGGNIENLEYLKDCGVKMMTLTWNGQCEIGGGSLAAEPNGITEFGKNVIKSMEKLSIAIDISHASDNLFYDVVNFSSGPLVASHSNSRSVCKHRRNLTDEQFKIIKSRNGIVGLNFSRDFLKENDASAYDILRHADYFLSMGGEKTLCIGTDFDGTDMPNGISGIESMQSLYELFLKHNYKESLIDDIFFNNAFEFFTRLK